jgi:RHS repeat-associated protein
VQRFTNHGYDDFNRLQYTYFTSIVPEDPGSIFFKYAYFDDGQRQSERDPEGHVTSFGYDELKRLTTVTQTVGVDTLTTAYGYDVQDNLSSVTDPNGLVTTYTNHDMGWRLRVDSPDTGTTTYAFDPAGNLTSTTTANGVTSNRAYDALDRLTFLTYPDSSLNVTQSYDSGAVTFGIGRRTGMTDASGSTLYGYDRRGLPTREERTIGTTTYVTQYAYDKTGNLKQILYPTDNPSLRQGQADYTYDAADRVTAVTAKVNGATTTVASSIAYKPFGPRTSLMFGNGLLDSRTYGTRYQLGTWTLGSLLSYTHAFNNDLNLTSRTDNLNGANNRSFGYDEIHRLRAAAGPWGPGTGCTGGATYTYDRNGNRLCKGETPPATNYIYFSGTNRLSATTGGEPATYGYDSNGNTTGDGTHTYEYSDADRLESVDSGSTATYTYDGDGRRVIKSVGSSTTYFFYDPAGRLLAETVPASGRGKDYVYLLDAPIGRVDWSTEQDLGNVLRVAKNSPNVRLDWTLYPAGSNTYVVRRKQVVNPNDKTFDGAVALATVTDPTRIYDDPALNDGNDYNYRVFRRVLDESSFFYHADHLGTPIAMTGGAASVVWRAEHRPFGGVHSFPVSSVANNLRFPGQYSDAETALHQNGFRDYAPHTGRFVKADPLGLPGGLALYEYVRSNPLSNSDPEGLLPKPSQPGEPNPCKYYEEVCRELGCDYHCNVAPKYCRRGGSILNRFDNEATKTCIRFCLQEQDSRELGRSPSCSPCFTCPEPHKRCLNERCITSYHRTCFVKCNATSRHWWPGIFPGPGVLFPGEGC